MARTDRPNAGYRALARLRSRRRHRPSGGTVLSAVTPSPSGSSRRRPNGPSRQRSLRLALRTG
eukprot:10899273-Lingulodinium_polyedra.AAC.1